MKIFLSHSSKDKDIVGKVYEHLGAGICHYDIATFDPTGFLPTQIYNALNESTHFVLFASAAALSSNWVQGELKIAFSNWMQSKTTTVMVFLIRDGQRTNVPQWLQSYVVTEHPSPAHMACRVLSEYDSWQEDNNDTPPFYRLNELKIIEKHMLVEAKKMPSCLLISGPDGLGRKELINQIYTRNFRFVAKRKILITSDSFDSDIDLYKSLKGVVSLVSARELIKDITAYQALPLSTRITGLVNLVVEACQSGQTLIIDAADSIYNDSGEMHEWLELLITGLPTVNYPYLNITTNRRPNFINSNLAHKIATCNLEPLLNDDSSLLFQWWLNKHNIKLTDPIRELVLEQVSGNAKQIMTAVLLLNNLQDLSDISKIKKNVFPDLERNATKLLNQIAINEQTRLTMALVVNCGQISISELISVTATSLDVKDEVIKDSIHKLIAYGLLQSDNISIKVPNFLIRTARTLSTTTPTAKQLENCWKILSESVSEISLDDQTTVTMLNEACMLRLKSGINSIIGIESLILPSQYLRAARQSYDSNDYKQAYEFCSRAYKSRLILTDDGAIEALRYCGMSAARLNNEAWLDETIRNFAEYSSNIRARRMAEFITGFDFRLAGKFDKALEHMLMAYSFKGNQDIHVLRELAFLYLATNDPVKAKQHISNPIVNKFRFNTFILEMKILIELAFGEGYVLQNKQKIAEMIDELDSMDSNSKNYSFKTKIEYLLLLGNTPEARYLFDKTSSHQDHTARVLSEAKILLSEKKYQESYDVLTKLRRAVLTNEHAQRRSILPVITDLMIQSASGVSLSKGIEEFKLNKHYMPNAIIEKNRKELYEVASFSRERLSPDELLILKI